MKLVHLLSKTSMMDLSFSRGRNHVRAKLRTPLPLPLPGILAPSALRVESGPCIVLKREGFTPVRRQIYANSVLSHEQLTICCARMRAKPRPEITVTLTLTQARRPPQNRLNAVLLGDVATTLEPGWWRVRAVQHPVNPSTAMNMNR